MQFFVFDVLALLQQICFSLLKHVLHLLDSAPLLVSSVATPHGLTFKVLPFVQYHFQCLLHLTMVRFCIFDPGAQDVLCLLHFLLKTSYLSIQTACFRVLFGLEFFDALLVHVLMLSHFFHGPLNQLFSVLLPPADFILPPLLHVRQLLCPLVEFLLSHILRILALVVRIPTLVHCLALFFEHLVDPCGTQGHVWEVAALDSFSNLCLAPFLRYTSFLHLTPGFKGVENS
mmetsp:Transcript_162306/g.311614  ORF Transcript_162306/g.311614 Transcript_162306/m.311614 type:complete len:230 (-) Transcript_162306:608-1297(-)